METIDNRASIFEINEIYKYKDLITSEDRNVIKAIIFKGDEQSLALHRRFMELVASEIDHTLNKTSFAELKDNLIIEMKQYLDN